MWRACVSGYGRVCGRVRVCICACLLGGENKQRKQGESSEDKQHVKKGFQNKQAAFFGFNIVDTWVFQ